MAPSGGAGTVLGVDYQARVAAWLSTRALAGRAASTQMGWEPRSEIRSIQLETFDAVDDMRISTAHDGNAYIQAKHAVQASARESSPLAKTLHQFAVQELDELDRLILITSSSSSSLITKDLRRVLDRVRAVESSAPEAVCRTQSETRVFAIVCEILRREWGTESPLTEQPERIRQLLSQVHVAVVDVEQSEFAAIEADRLLRGLLFDPDLSPQAWLQLIDLANQTAILQAGLTPSSIARHLEESGFQLGPQLNFRADIERLRGFSSQVMERLRPYRSLIGDDGANVTIDRDFAHDLLAATDESLLITGDPGAGKSGALAELVDLLAHADVVVMSADSLADLTSGQLRSEIGLDHGLIEVLSNWRSDLPGYVVIDALDAGRGFQSQRALMELIDSVTRMAGRWKVVATVRRFDLRYSPSLKELFPLVGSGVAEQYRLVEFSRVRHFNIGALSPGEIAQLDDTAPQLSQKVSSAAPALRDLLRNPFSLRLFADLVSGGDSTDQVAQISSRLQLLDSYWDQRVLDSPVGSYRRENLLRRISSDMVARGVLTVDRATLSEEFTDDIADLLRVGVLVEDVTGPFRQFRLLTFAHHVLFDYAVARNFHSSQDVQSEAGSNPTSLFLVRPSYQMYFERLWSTQPTREDFWALALSIAASQDVPEIAKVIAPAVAASAVASDGDLIVFLAALDGELEGAAVVLHHLVNALLTDEAGHAISLDRATAWASFTESISRRLDIPRAVAVRNMIRELTAIEGTLESSVALSVSVASRRLVRWTWAENREDRFFTHVAILAVTSTFTSDEADSIEILRKIIAPERLAKFGYIEMPTLADAVPDLLQHDPGLVRDIYAAAFEFQESSTDATPITRGILNMSSNRRQDYQHSHYTLAKHYPEFLEAAPIEAIAALCALYARYASRYAYSNHVVDVSWAMEKVSFLDDYLLESAHHSSDEEVEMLDAFKAWLLSPGSTTDEQRRRFELATETLRAHVAPAALWRAILRTIPGTVELHMIAPLLRSPSSLTSQGLMKPIGELLRSRFEGLDAPERLQIEDAVINLDKSDDRTSRIRTRLIALFPDASLQTEKGRALWQEAHERDDAIGDQGLFVENEDSEFDRKEDLRRYGVDPDLDSNARIILAAQPIKDFNDQHLNGAPSGDSVGEITPQVLSLWSCLSDSVVRRDATTTLVAWSFNDLARAVEILSRSALQVSIDQAELDNLIEITASLMSERTDEPENVEEFDAGSVRSFELPSLVVQTSVALMYQGLVDVRLEDLVRAAAVDRSPSVRISVAGQIAKLREVRPELVDAVLAIMEAEEESGHVVERLASTIAAVDWEKPDQLVGRLRQLYARSTILGARGDGARKTCCEIATELFVREGIESAGAFVRELINRATSSAADLEGIARVFRSSFAVHGLRFDARRKRAFTLAVKVVLRACSSFAVAQRLTGHDGEDDLHSDKLVKDLAHIIEGISNDVYFSSGAYEHPGREVDGDSTPPIADYYESARALLLALPDIPFPSVVHHVLETLDYLSPANPAQIFRDMTDVILRGRAGGYEYDQLAASFVTGSVSRFLIQHRHLLQTDADLRKRLIQVLDTFVAVGWGEARSLTYQLDTVFR